MRKWMLAVCLGIVAGCGQPALNSPQETGMKIQNWYGAGLGAPVWGGYGAYGSYGLNPWAYSYGGLYPGFSPYGFSSSPLFYGGDVLYRQLPSQSARLIAGTLAGGYALPSFFL